LNIEYKKVTAYIYIYIDTLKQTYMEAKKLGGKTPTITKDGGQGGSLPLTIGSEEKRKGEQGMLPEKDLVAGQRATWWAQKFALLDIL
jgi:hypothetical protein